MTTDTGNNLSLVTTLAIIYLLPLSLPDIDIGEQFVTSVFHTGDKQKVMNISMDFRKTLKFPQKNAQGPEKNDE